MCVVLLHTDIDPALAWSGHIGRFATPLFAFLGAFLFVGQKLRFESAGGGGG